MNDDAIKNAKVKTMHIPTVLGAVVPVYNLKGITQDLNFSGDVIADIYLGRITKWNDARIAKDNPGVKLALTQPFFPCIAQTAAERPSSLPTTSPR